MARCSAGARTVQVTRVVAYLRVSTEEQAQQGVSLEAQRAKAEAYCALYDLQLVKVCVDAGVSAKAWGHDLDDTLQHRPALADALAELQASRADAVLVLKLDRLTRSVRDLGALVERFFMGDRWALLSMGEQIDTRSAAGRLVLNVLASVAQWEREATGERTSLAMQHLRSAGKYTGGAAPYGWAVAADGVHLQRHEGEQAAVDAAVALRAQGLSLRAVGSALQERGHLPRSGGQWHAKTVQDLLGCA
jgi:DNA invertase Pin-like site-specific DNA recombinase